MGSLSILVLVRVDFKNPYRSRVCTSSINIKVLLLIGRAERRFAFLLYIYFSSLSLKKGFH